MEIKPFKAFRFNDAKVGDAGDCIAPPYDVVNDEQREQLYQKSRYNIIRITKGKTNPDDNVSDNQYTRAAAYLREWMTDGVLKQDKQETIYGYVQDFRLGGEKFERFSFIALGKSEEFGKIVRPHEQTLDKPKADRLNLERATAAKFGLIFMLYEDSQKTAEQIIEKVLKETALVDFRDENAVRHRLFAITSGEDIKKIASMMSDKSCIIADGHHRYETGLNYYKETGNPAAAYQMIAFSNMRHEGLAVLATHRVVDNLEGFDIRRFIAELSKKFEITEYQFDIPRSKVEAKQKMLSQMKAEYGNGGNVFGIYAGDGAFRVAVLKDRKAMDPVAPNMSDPWKSLDVSVLHRLILGEILGIDEKKLATGGNIEYIKDTDTAVDESIAKVDYGHGQVLFLMNPVRLQQLKMVTDAGEKMPQKSTYFYPKVYTGLTINKM